MKLKIAAMLLVSVLMSANTSYGDLLDRMLGRAGCSSCAAPAAKSCGGGGFLDKLMSCGRDSCNNASILNVDPAPSCGCEAAAPSCGCEAAAPSCGCEAAPVAEASPCGCEAAPAPSAPCGCDAAPMVDASPCGCEAAPVADASPCGCEAAPAAAAACESKAAPAGLLDLLRRKCGCGSAGLSNASSCGGGQAAASSCGCESAPMAASHVSFASSPEMVHPFASHSATADCGCGSSGGFLSRLKGMGCDSGCGSTPALETSACGCDAAPAVAASSCGCDAAPAVATSSCGCDAAPAVAASSCGCDAAPAVATSSCGCDAAPAVAASSCGCDAAPAVATSSCGCGAAPASSCGCEVQSGGCRSGGGGTARPRLSLLDRLKGNRVPRDRNGKVIGVCNDGCNPPCPRQPNAGCGCGSHVVAHSVEAAPCSSCSTCGGGEVIYSDAMPVSGCANGSCGSTPVYGSAVALPAAAAATSEGSGSRAAPVVPAETQQDLQDVEAIERRDVTQPSVSDGEDDPIVDPGAFVPRSTNTLGS